MPRPSMVFPHIRRVGRVFAIVLLVWTTVDLIDHNVCVTHAAPAPGARGTVIGYSAEGPSPLQAPQADHSFCCSHTVDVRTPFRLALTLGVIGLAPENCPLLPFHDSSGLYHPPLA